MESDEEEVGCLKLYTEKLGFMHPSEKSSKFLIVFFLFLKIFIFFWVFVEIVSNMLNKKKDILL